MSAIDAAVEPESVHQAVERACALLGGAVHLANAFEDPVHPVVVSEWRRRIRPVPLERCVDIEIATGRRVRCEEVRPDKARFFAYLRNSLGAGA